MRNSWSKFRIFFIAGIMMFTMMPFQAMALLPPVLPDPSIPGPILPDPILPSLIPKLMVVTPVPTETYDKTPDFTFSSTQFGTIIYEGDCSSTTTAAVSGDNTVTFDSMLTGTYSNCKISVKNSLDFTSAKLTVPSFTIKQGIIIDPSLFDLTAPTISLVSGVTSPTSDSTPSVVITTNEAGFASYQGACLSNTSSVTVGENTITFLALDAGSYSDCKIRVADKWGNLSSPVSIPVFTVIQLSVAKCAGFTDVTVVDADCNAIEYVKSIGAMTGNPDGTFDPAGLLQRDQVSKIALEAFGNFSASSDYCAGKKPFPDVASADWAYQYVCRAKALSVVTGYMSGADAGYFRPARSVNRVEFLAIILRNMGEIMPSGSSYTDVHSTDWFTDYAKFSKDNSLFTGTTLKPSNFTSRREVAQVLYKLHNLGKI